MKKSLKGMNNSYKTELSTKIFYSIFTMEKGNFMELV